MSVRVDGPIIHLEGRCRVEDAEPLLRHLLADASARVDISGAEHLHSAVLQVLIAAGPEIQGGDPQGFVRRWILPAGAKT